MLSTSTATVTHEQPDMPVTSCVVTDSHQVSLVKEPQPFTTANYHVEQLLVEQMMMDCHKRQQPRESHAVVSNQQLPTSSLLRSSHGKVSRTRANSSRGRQKTTSLSDRTVSAHGVIFPAAAANAIAANHHSSNLASGVDAKARLRELIPSGRRCHRPRHGRPTSSLSSLC